MRGWRCGWRKRDEDQKIAKGALEMKVVEEELLDNSIEVSGIFLNCLGR